MSLAKRLEEGIEPGTRGGSVCDVRRAQAGLDQADADALATLIYRRRDLSSAEVTAVLAEEGIDIAPHTIGRHRRGNCRNCAKG